MALIQVAGKWDEEMHEQVFISQLMDERDRAHRLGRTQLADLLDKAAEVYLWETCKNDFALDDE